MIIDDKKRVIGKIVSINSDRFSVELLSGIKNFNVNGYDDIHYFAQINSYVVVPYQDYYIVSEVVSVREKDSQITSNNQKEQELNKMYSTKYLEVLPIGTIKQNEFVFGVSVYPTLYSDVLYIKDKELDSIFKVSNIETAIAGEENKTRLDALEIGTSAIFQDYSIKIGVDKFFGGHSAVLGNTGSGKSCTISSMVQTLFKKKEFSAVGSSFVFFDVNGEYEQAFEELHNENDDVNVKSLSIEDSFALPHYFLNVEEWELLLNASEKTQLPILRNALGLSTLFSDATTQAQQIKNHILASCILETFNSGDSPVSKYQKIQALKNRGTFEADLDKGYDARFGNFPNETAENNFLGKVKNHLMTGTFEIPSYKNKKFEFSDFGEYLDMAILYEEAHGNRQIRDYCSSLITRFKSLQEREDFYFLREHGDIETINNFLKDILGINGQKKVSQITLIDLNSSEDEVVEVISAVVTRLIFDKLRRATPRNTFPINLVLEEAHRYISYDSKRTFLRANQIFDRVAKEGRKYGLFFLISSQRPSELSKTVLSQCNNFIVHRIQNPDDLSHIRQITPHISETTLKKLPSIPTQHALIFGSAVNIPTLFKVNNADPLPNSDNNHISENWFIDKNTTIGIFEE